MIEGFTAVSRTHGRVRGSQDKNMLASLFHRRRTPRLPLPPTFPHESRDPGQADLALLARALQQLLAKWPPQVTRRHFPAATKAHQALRIQACLPGAVRLPPYLLSDLCHEIAEHVDAPVRQAAVRCMRRGRPVA